MVNWKAIAIVFIILFIIETLIIGWAYNKGVSMEENKIKCSNEICFEVDADSFLYDDYTNTCYCYKNNDVVKQVILK